MIGKKSFALAASAYCMLRIAWLVEPSTGSGVLRFYGSDVLCPLVLIPLFATIQGWFGARKPNIGIGFFEVSGYILLFGIMFEIVLPQVFVHMTSDWLDILAYATGGLLLWLSEGRRLKENKAVQR